jgi:membrane protein
MIRKASSGTENRGQSAALAKSGRPLMGVREIIWQTAQGWINDRALSMGASLAFYTTFSMTPLLLIVISVAGVWFGNDVARDAVVSEFEHLAGTTAAQSVNALLLNAHLFGPGIVGVALGLFTFFVSATAAFIELQDDLNAILRAEPPPLSRYWVFLRQRLISLAMILAIGFLLIVSLAIDAGISAFDKYLNFDLMNAYVAVMAVVGNLAISIVLFSLIFRFLPTIRLPWRPILAGATLTSITFLIGKFLIGFYLGQSHVASAFGAAASLITILLWVYYSSQILLLGAEFIATICGRRIVEKSEAHETRTARHRRPQA